jgi:nucleotide-binding universal stress UspA family protein
MKSILVAVDGSAPSLKGVQAAIELSKALGHALELVYVLPPVLLPPSVYAETIQKLEDGNRALGAQVLEQAQALVRDAGAKADVVQVSGAPAEAIADLAVADRVWGVVIGAKGHNALSRVLLGSVADRLLHICSKPVLVVR